MKLMNDNTEARTRSSEHVDVLPCGCAHTKGEIQRWLQLCDAHDSWSALHEAARLAHATEEAPS